MFTQAQSLDADQNSSGAYGSPNLISPTTATVFPQPTTSEEALHSTLAAIGGDKFYFCDYKNIPTKSVLPRKLLIISARKGTLSQGLQIQPSQYPVWKQ